MPTALRRHVSRSHGQAEPWPWHSFFERCSINSCRCRKFSAPPRFASSLPALAAIARPAKAGGGPENVLLVVNSRSDASLTVANHYCRLRRIPPSNVVDLDWPGSTDWTDIETFRQKILQPALQTAAERGLGEQIDYVVYFERLPHADRFRLGMAPRTARQASTLRLSHFANVSL